MRSAGRSRSPEPAEEPGEVLDQAGHERIDLDVGPGAGKVSTTTVSTARAASSTTSVGRLERGASLARREHADVRRQARSERPSWTVRPVGATARSGCVSVSALLRVGLDEQAGGAYARLVSRQIS